MSGNYAASLTDEWRRRFDAIWHVDFEYRQDRNYQPVPVCCYAVEQYTGQEIELWQDRLAVCRRAPWDTGPRSVTVAYASNAELSCFLQLNWPFPVHVIDVYVEVIAAINGNDAMWAQKKRPSLLEALSLYGIDYGMEASEKDRIRNLILSKTNYTPDERRDIQNYNREDVVATLELLQRMGPAIDLERSLFRGRYMAAVARMERCGLPVDSVYLDQLRDNWQRVQLHYIAKHDDLHLYDGTSFREARLQQLIDDNGWDWQRTPTGRLDTKVNTFGKQARRYPILKNVAKLRNNVMALSLPKLSNTVGADGFSRCPLLPFWTKTGRNQPAAHDKRYLPSETGWLHGIIRPPPGWGVVELDWDGQEIAIMAGLSGDPAMIADYNSGDPHLAFGKRAGLVPHDATKETHGEFRNKVLKPIVLGQNYGMGPFGIQAKTKKSLLWAREAHASHRLIYPVFHNWRDDMIAQAKFDTVMESLFGWPLAVTSQTSNRTLMNFPAQAGGADMMRIVAIAATEAGIRTAAVVHDAFWVMAPLDELDDTIERMKAIMLRVGEAVTGLHVGVTVEHIVRWPNCLGDVRNRADSASTMWHDVKALLPELQKRSGANAP
jgi:DNA polymerase family A